MSKSFAVRPEFATHLLNDAGQQKAAIVGDMFTVLLRGLEDPSVCDTTGREMSIVRTKLEEACFFARKAMGSRPENTI